MIKIFKTFGGYIEIPGVEKGCWINVTQPNPQEIERIITDFQVPADIVQDVLDADERPRVEFDDFWTLVIMRIPVESSNNGVPYFTVPLGIFVAEDFTLTICNQDNEILPFKQATPFREHYQQITDVFNFILRLFLRSGGIYLKYLKQINQQTTLIEQEIEESVKSSELRKLLKMEKCLVYFITSIKSNEIVLAKLRNSKKITTEINEDLLEDAIIENKQALEMAQIYADIQSGMMDAFASLISNNLNVVMKKLALISIILMIPTLVASLFGMNVPNLMENSVWALPAILVLSSGLIIIGVLLFRRKQWF
ncbi:MAG: magnesium transporter CorA family protein [Salinivirgaceae bacterium]